MLWKGNQSPRVNKETKPMLRGKWESGFSDRHKDNVPKKTPVVSVMILQLLETEVVAVRDAKADRLHLHPTRRQNRLTEKKGDKEESSDKRSQIVCRYKNWKNPSCKFWHPPVSQNSLCISRFLSDKIYST